MYEYSYVWLYVGSSGRLHMAVDMSHAVDDWDRTIDPVPLQLRTLRVLWSGNYGNLKRELCHVCANNFGL